MFIIETISMFFRHIYYWPVRTKVMTRIGMHRCFDEFTSIFVAQFDNKGMLMSHKSMLFQMFYTNFIISRKQMQILSH